MEEAPEAFQLLFKLPSYNATKRHTIGGGRGQIDLEEESMDDWEAMCKYVRKNPLCTFAAAVVVVVTHSGGEALPEPIRVRGWKEPKVKKLNS